MVARNGLKRACLTQVSRALGFTLIEMAIVLVVIGLVISGGLVAVSPIVQNTKVSQTNQKLDRIEQALQVHVQRYGCLPCPANGATASTNTANNPGWAVNNTPATYSNGCATCNTVQGVVPWVNLGLSEADITDGFGARIDYAVSPLLAATTNVMARSGTTYPTGGVLIVQNAAGTELTSSTGLRAAYVLISHGSNRSRAYIAQTGTQIASSNTSALEDDNGIATHATTTTPYVQDDLNEVTYFDDIVRWRTAPLLIQQCGAGNCGNPA